MKKNKSLIIILLIVVVGIVGLTLAYFTNTANVSNEFKSKEYGTTVTEEFFSPDNWLPGSTEPKNLTVTNSGQVDEAVRVSYVETWTSKNGKNLSLTQGDNRAAIINWANVSDWTTVTENGVEYKYYNYKLAPNETTSTLLDSVTFNKDIVNANNCVETKTETGKKVECTSDGAGYDGATYKLTFIVETVQYDQYKNAWGTNVVIAKSKPMTVQQFVASKTNASTITSYNDASADKGKMFVFNHEATEQTGALTDYRYIGDSPNNFVYFNCTDDNDTDSCEVWRIIGVFSVDRTDPNDSTKTITEQRIKLVRGSDFKDTIKWDDRNDDNGCSLCGKNDWNGSYINTYLNGTYYESLSATVKLQMEDVVYYLGGRAWDNTTHYGSAQEMYTWERGTTIYNNTRSTSWKGKVALMYPSDVYMTYGKGVDNTCYNDPYSCYNGTPTTGWIYNMNKLEGSDYQQWTWLLSPDSFDTNRVLYAHNKVGYLNWSSANYAGVIRPVVYLKSSIQIIEGEGTEQSPYILK